MAVVSGLLVTLAGLTGCGSTKQSSAAAEPDVVRLGTTSMLTGNDAAWGKSMIEAQQLAVREANDAGGVLGRKVELVVADDACDPGASVAAANTLVSRDITMFLGGSCSSSTMPMLKIFHDAGIPMILPICNSTELLAPGYDSVFMLSGTVTAEAVFAVDRLRNLDVHRMAVIEDGTSFSSALATAIVESAGAHSGLEVSAKLKLTPNAPSFSRIAQATIASGADSVFYTGYDTEAHQLILDLRNAGFAGKIVGGDGTSDTLVKDLPDQQSANILRFGFPEPQFMPELGDWSARFKATTGNEPTGFTPQSYDAVTLALDAIRRAGSPDRSAVRQAIASTTGLKLLSGETTFNQDGTLANPRFLLYRTEAGKFVRIADNG